MTQTTRIDTDVSPSRGAALHRAARGSAINFLGTVVSAVATFALTVVVARLTTPAQAGVFFSATSLFLLFSSLGRLGTDSGLVYFLSQSRALGQLSHARTYMRTAAVPVLATSTVLAGVVLIAAEPLGRLLSPGREDDFAGAMRVLAVLIPVAAALHLAVSGSRGLGTMKVSAVVDQMARPTLQLALVTAGLLTVGAASLPWAWGLAYLPLAVVAVVWWGRLRDRTARQVTDPTFRPARKFWTFTWPRALGGVAQVAQQRLDIILVGALAGLPSAAIYAAVTRFVALGQMAARAVSLSVQPLLGEALARDDRGGARALYQVSTGWLVLVTWPLYLTLITFGTAALSVFGRAYSTGADALLILCCAMLVATACGMVNMVLVMAGKSFWNLTNIMLAFLVTVSLDLVLIPRVGIVGAALGWTAGILVVNLLPLAQLQHWLGLHPFGRETLLAMAVTTGTFLLVPSGIRLVAGGGVNQLLLALAAAVLLYGLLLVMLRRVLQLDTFLASLRSGGRKRRQVTHVR